jgi:predicted dehydrogenase
MTEKIRICIIGCGSFARNFVPLFKAHPEVEKVCVCDLIPERSAEYANKFDVEVIDSFEEALKRSDINSIAIFVQRHLHGPLVIQALKAGKHVYSAVPCASTIEEIYEIEELVRKTRLTYSMGETGYYRAATIFCRDKMRSGEMGDFVYGEAQYNHDQRHFDYTRNGPGWQKIAGIPPMLYPTHSTAMILGAMPGVFAKKVTAFGYVEKKLPDIFGTDSVNLWNNPFSNTAMLVQLSNGGIARISENRRVAFSGPNTYISQFYGSDATYEFSMVHHYFSRWDAENPKKLITSDVTNLLQPKGLFDFINEPNAAQRITDGFGFRDVSPIHPVDRLPREFDGLPNGHNGTHQFMVDDFCLAVATGKLSPTNIWQAARFNLPGLVAHQSALKGGELMDVPDLGDPPSDWELLFN